MQKINDNVGFLTEGGVAFKHSAFAFFFHFDATIGQEIINLFPDKEFPSKTVAVDLIPTGLVIYARTQNARTLDHFQSVI